MRRECWRCVAAVNGPNAGYMFMFRSRRATLTKRLLKARRRRGGDDDGVARLLRELQDNQLGMLWAAVESRGRDMSSCVLLPKERQAHVLCCQTWRWPELVHGADLRRLPGCRSAGDPVYVCCNPYHWSRVYQPGEHFVIMGRNATSDPERGTDAFFQLLEGAAAGRGTCCGWVVVIVNGVQ